MIFSRGVFQLNICLCINSYTLRQAALRWFNSLLTATTSTANQLSNNCHDKHRNTQWWHTHLFSYPLFSMLTCISKGHNMSIVAWSMILPSVIKLCVGYISCTPLIHRNLVLNLTILRYCSWHTVRYFMQVTNGSHFLLSCTPNTKRCCDWLRGCV